MGGAYFCKRTRRELPDGGGQRLLVARSGVYRIADGPVRSRVLPGGDALFPMASVSSTSMGTICTSMTCRVAGISDSRTTGCPDRWAMASATGGSWRRSAWSPDGEQIAYIQVDSREVGKFPRINYTESLYPVAEYLRFPKVGTPIANCAWCGERRRRPDPLDGSSRPARNVLPQKPRWRELGGARRGAAIRARDRRNVLFANVRTSESVAPTRSRLGLGGQQRPDERRHRLVGRWAGVRAGEREGWLAACVSHLARRQEGDTAYSRCARYRDAREGKDRRGGRWPLLPCVTRRRHPEASLSRAPGCHWRR